MTDRVSACSRLFRAAISGLRHHILARTALLVQAVLGLLNSSIDTNLHQEGEASARDADNTRRNDVDATGQGLSCVFAFRQTLPKKVRVAVPSVTRNVEVEVKVKKCWGRTIVCVPSQF